MSDGLGDLEKLIQSALGQTSIPPLDLRTAPKENIVYKVKTYPFKFSFCDCCEKIIPSDTIFCPACLSYKRSPVPYEMQNLLTTKSKYIDYNIFIE